MSQIFSVSCIRLVMVAFVPLFLFFTGCSMVNAPIAAEKRVALLSKTEMSEVYKSGPLTVTYEYQKTGDKLIISGSVEFRQSVDSLDVRIVFLDAAGLVLGKKIVYSSGFRSLASTDSTRTFRTKFEMPAGVVGFSFTESSVARHSRR
jgi:hypothetical protein